MDADEKNLDTAHTVMKFTKLNLSQQGKPSLEQCHLYKYRFQTLRIWGNSETLRKSELTMDMVEENWNGNGHGWKNLKLQKIWNCNGHGWGRPRVLLLFRLFSRREKCSLALPPSGWEIWNSLSLSFFVFVWQPMASLRNVLVIWNYVIPLTNSFHFCHF